jgi:hypothetical protein
MSAVPGMIAATAAAIKDQCREIAAAAAESPVLVMTGARTGAAVWPQLQRRPGPGCAASLTQSASGLAVIVVFAAGRR